MRGCTRWIMAALAWALVGGCAADIATPEGLAPESAALAEATQAAARPLQGPAGDHGELLAMAAGARVVLLGEATHGTHEFYRARAEITRRLITEHGFTAVAVETDWPEALPVNRYVRGMGGAASGREALAGLDQFPGWMWRNAEVLELVEWLAEYNRGRPAGEQVGFYGIDLQTFAPATTEVIRFLESADAAAAARARERYRCLRRYEDDPGGYARAVEREGARGCQAEVEAQVAELESQRAALVAAGGEEAFLGALQSARMLDGAEEYFRLMFRPGVSTWNFRDRFMAEVVEVLAGRSTGKVVVWAHNSHVGDARATEMGEGGELNLGQLARERWGEDALLVGFTTYRGEVIAASAWGGRGETKTVRPALPGSYEEAFHQAGIPAFMLPLRGLEALAEPFRDPRLERAIGVLYLPETERQSHYFRARLADQFDAVIHFDRTTPVQPLR